MNIGGRDCNPLKIAFTVAGHSFHMDQALLTSVRFDTVNRQVQLDLYRDILVFECRSHVSTKDFLQAALGSTLGTASNWAGTFHQAMEWPIISIDRRSGLDNCDGRRACRSFCSFVNKLGKEPFGELAASRAIFFRMLLLLRA